MRIPDLISEWYVSVARLLVGAVSALVVYAAVKAEWIHVFDTNKGGAGFILLAFASGFSERLVMGALDKMGAGEAAPPTQPTQDDDGDDNPQPIDSKLGGGMDGGGGQGGG